ncbi:unannotated protein [freshwater metagenome]|uniref:Unannotated protein n=1 Tax=freshwater metagenome TaxID=449393 RepID=A0A6J7B108_9ZZZZ
MIAKWSRRFILCIPDVLRQGSTRGGAGGAFKIEANSCSAHCNFPATERMLCIASRSSTSNSTSRAAYVNHSCGSGRVDQSAALCSFARVTPMRDSNNGPRPTRGKPAIRPANSVSKSSVGLIPISRKQGKSCVLACKITSSVLSNSLSVEISG